MSLESELRAAMRAHDDEAPEAMDFVLPAHPNRQRHWAPAITAAVVIALIATTVGVLVARTGRGGGRSNLARHPPAAAGQAPCPRRFRPSNTQQSWVPRQPTVPGAADRLVPTAAPTIAVVCSYAHSKLARTDSDALNALVGGRAIRNSRTLAASLSAQPRTNGSLPCTMNLEVTDGDNYLLRLSYSDGTVWVSVPGDHCDGSGNGVFASRSNLRSPAAAAYATGQWPTEDHVTRSADQRCVSRAGGRLGDDERIVPAGWTSVSVCEINSREAPRLLSDDDATGLVDRLNRLHSRRSKESCRPIRGEPFVEYLVGAQYADGPDEDVTVDAGCSPQVDNGALQAKASHRLVNGVARFAGG